MKVLVIGGGGREHALCWKISRSSLVKKIFCAPGNAGTSQVAENVAIAANDLEKLLAFAKKESIDLTVVGPEDPLCLGIVDLFQKEKLRIFGPSRRAAELEGSKAFCKEILRRHKIPTASYRSFETMPMAMAYLETLRQYPVVVKASGLAAGKGVIICRSHEEAREAVEQTMERRAFGEAGKTVVIEEFLLGEEVSVLTLTDGETIIPLEPSQDHKTVFDGDRGPNTGGMGAICPVSTLNPRILAQIESQILVPTIHAMNREGRGFRGILYAGLMLTEQGPRVLEFNVRFGDPETQAVLMRVRSDLVPYFLHASEGTLSQLEGLDWDPRASISVVAASKGYPGPYEKGKVIEGLDAVETGDDLQVFHAGTAVEKGKIVTSGGRVLAVSALGEDLARARDRAYAALERIRFEGIHSRRDIGFRVLGKG